MAMVVKSLLRLFVFPVTIMDGAAPFPSNGISYELSLISASESGPWKKLDLCGFFDCVEPFGVKIKEYD
jgi:hypothetical protein